MTDPNDILVGISQLDRQQLAKVQVAVGSRLAILEPPSRSPSLNWFKALWERLVRPHQRIRWLEDKISRQREEITKLKRARH